MKLRSKLIWAGILIVSVPMLLSTGVMWYLIREQHTEEAYQHSGQLIEMIREELTRQGEELTEELRSFSQDTDLLNSLAYLNPRQKINMTPLLQDFHKTEAAVLLEKFARINQYDFVLLFDQNQRLLSFVKFDREDGMLGITTQEHLPSPQIKVINTKQTIWRSADIDPSQWGTLRPESGIPTQLDTVAQAPSHAIEVLENRIVVKTSVPIQEHLSKDSPFLGQIDGFRYLNERLITKLAEHTQAEVNFFLDTHLSGGTLTEFRTIEESQLVRLRQSSPLYTEQRVNEQAYYQAYYPLIRDGDGSAAITLVLSLSQAPTFQKTHEMTVLQAGVSIVSVLLILPFALFLAARVTKPLQQIAAVSEAIANGQIEQSFTPFRSKDEIGVLSRSFAAMLAYLQTMTDIATKMSRGQILHDFKPKSHADTLGKAYQRMTLYFQTLAQLASRIQTRDLTQTLSPQSPDDLLGTTFNGMIHSLRDLVSHLRSESRELADSSASVALAAAESSQASATQAESVESMSSALQEMASNIESILQTLTSQSQMIDAVNTSTQRIHRSNEDVTSHIEQLSSFTEQTAASIEKMDRSVQEIHLQVENSVEASKQVLGVAQQGSTQVNQLMAEIQQVHEQVVIASEAILRLERQSHHIGEILEVIQEVVDQTNLLALNASIIAAQAGEQGRAFTVVADEVKALATRTAESTKEISQFLQTVRQELTEAVNAMVISTSYIENGLQGARKTEHVLEAVTKGAEQSSHLIVHTAQNIEEHTYASQEVRRASAKTVHMLEETMALTREQQQQSENIDEQTGQLLHVSDVIQHATEEQASAAQQSVEIMNNISIVVQKNAARAERLAHFASRLSAQANSSLTLVEQFTIDEEAVQLTKTEKKENRL